jgi:predicted naringenin-chalcone synthase
LFYGSIRYFWVTRNAQNMSLRGEIRFYKVAINRKDMQILNIQTALPNRGFTTEELMRLFPCSLSEGTRENILNLGVSKRYLLTSRGVSLDHEALMDEKGLVDLCSAACSKALKKSNLEGEDVDYLVVTYDANPILSPGLSQLLIPNLSMDKYVKHVNVQGIASTAFPKALELAKDHLASHSQDHVLVCVSGMSSCWFQNQVLGLKGVMDIKQIIALKNEYQKTQELRKWVATIQFFLFGDGAAAVMVANEGEGFCFDGAVEVTNVSNTDYLAGISRLAILDEPFRFGFYSHLDKEIPHLGVKYTRLALERLLGKNSAEIMKSVKKWAVHTGSGKILNALAEHNGVEPEKLKESHEVLANCGNLAGASLPFILEKIASNNRLSEGDRVLMVGYGWGFSASASLLEYRE